MPLIPVEGGGVVDQHPDGPKSGLGSGEHRLGFGFIRQVRFENDGAASEGTDFGGGGLRGIGAGMAVDGDVEAGTADFGVVPIENSSEGVINRTLDLLLQTTLTISGEISIPIHHSLMTKSGKMDGIARICAHPQALAH